MLNKLCPKIRTTTIWKLMAIGLTTLEELIVQEYWYLGIQEEQANVIWLKINDAWLRLYFDCGIIFWRSAKSEPIYSEPDSDEFYDYPLRNLGVELNIRNQTIIKCEAASILEGVRVSFCFGNGARLAFKNFNDSTTIEA
jgi:hypothetical protein